MNKLTTKPSQIQRPDALARFQKFYLSDNPFPKDPYVNRDSTDKRVNGGIYETEIHKSEFQQIRDNFLKQSQSDPNHLRLGYIVDTSYIGRGNGKSAFLINLKQFIDKEYCLDISEGKNKCFAVYVTPEAGGRTKTFPSFVDIVFNSIVKSDIIKNCLAILRLEAMKKLYAKADEIIQHISDEKIVNDLNTEEWFTKNGFDILAISDEIYKSEFLQQLPSDFPLFHGRSNFMRPFISSSDFTDYYFNTLKNVERITFLFSHLVDFFLAAGFNGAYVLVDDFERIPDFQSERQRRDFALQLRSCLFDGSYTNARIGFYDVILVLHAGVPRLMADAWSQSGMEQRVPIFPKISSNHVIRFESLSKKYAVLLLRKYISEYRIGGPKVHPLYPFTKDAVQKIGELSDYNAASMLKMANELLEKAADFEEIKLIDPPFIEKNSGCSRMIQLPEFQLLKLAML